jgi:hypothetical protein
MAFSRLRREALLTFQGGGYLYGPLPLRRPCAVAALWLPAEPGVPWAGFLRAIMGEPGTRGDYRRIFQGFWGHSGPLKDLSRFWQGDRATGGAALAAGPFLGVARGPQNRGGGGHFGRKIFAKNLFCLKKYCKIFLMAQAPPGLWPLSGNLAPGPARAWPLASARAWPSA